MKYKIIKECVIEGKYRSVGDTYQPRKYMSRAALEELEDYGFIKKLKGNLWRPENGDTYWYVTGTMEVCWSYYETATPHTWRRNTGNAFQTREEARRAVRWLEAFNTLREDTEGFVPNWNDDVLDPIAYSVTHDPTTRILFVVPTGKTQHGLLYFATKEDALRSVEEHRQPWLTYFGVEG